MLSTARKRIQKPRDGCGLPRKNKQPIERRRFFRFRVLRVSLALELAIGFRGILAAGISGVGFSGGVLGQIIAGNRRQGVVFEGEHHFKILNEIVGHFKV